MKQFLAVAALSAFALLAQAPAAKTAAPQAGKFERIRVHGASLEGNLSGDSPDREVSIYLPPSYGTAAARRYPVLYMLHGYTDSDANWFGLKGNHFVNVPASVDKAWAGGAAEMIIVMPNAYTKYAGSMYSNSVATGDWEAYVARDLVAYVDSHYRTLAKRESRGLVGHSMGGYGALRVGMKYPQVFNAVYAQSPCCMGANLTPSAAQMAEAAAITTTEQFEKAGFGTKAMIASSAAWSPNPSAAPYYDLPVKDGKPVPEVIAKWAANAPLAMVHQYIPQMKTFAAVAFDAGDKDTGIAQTVRDLSAIFKGYGIAHFTEIYEGDHVNRIGERIEKNVMPFFTKNLTVK